MNRFFMKGSKRFYLFIPLLIILLGSCSTHETPYVKPEVIDDYNVFSAQQLDYINNIDKFSCFYIEVKNGLSSKDAAEYAKTKYKEIKKQRKGNAKFATIYILYDLLNSDFYYELDNTLNKIISREHSGSMYKMSIDGKKDPFKSINSLADRRSSYIEFTKSKKNFKDYIEAFAVINPLDRIFEITNDLSQPSSNIIHKIFYHIPLNCTMVMIDLFDSVLITTIVSIIIFFICCFGLGTCLAVNREDPYRFLWWIYLIFFSFVLMCTTSLYQPDIEMARALCANGYNNVFNSIITDYYISFVDSESHSKLLNIIVIISLLFWFILHFDKAGDNFDKLIFGIIVSFVSNNAILLIVLGYLVSDSFLQICTLGFLDLNKWSRDLNIILITVVSVFLNMLLFFMSFVRDTMSWLYLGFSIIIIAINVILTFNIKDIVSIVKRLEK